MAGKKILYVSGVMTVRELREYCRRYRELELARQQFSERYPEFNLGKQKGA